MSFVLGDNNDHESNSEYFDVPLQQPYYLNTTSDYATVQNNNGQQPISASNAQYYQTSLQHDEHVHQNDFTPTPLSAEVSIPKISKRFDSSQNQIFKIEFEVVIKLQNDQTQQRTQYVQSSTLPKNRTVNRMNPYRKPTKQNFRNKSSDVHSYSSVAVPQLNGSSAVYMQNVDNNRTSQSQFQPSDGEYFSDNYDN